MQKLVSAQTCKFCRVLCEAKAKFPGPWHAFHLAGELRSTKIPRAGLFAESPGNMDQLPRAKARKLKHVIVEVTPKA